MRKVERIRLGKFMDRVKKKVDGAAWCYWWDLREAEGPPDYWYLKFRELAVVSKERKQWLSVVGTVGFGR
jgi:hypothetical protein